MASLNRVMIIGNLGSDPKVRRTQAGNAVANFSLATTEVRGSGEARTEYTAWHRVVVWGKLALTCGQYLSKGRQVYVEGRLQTRSYEDDAGGGSASPLKSWPGRSSSWAAVLRPGPTLTQ